MNFFHEGRCPFRHRVSLHRGRLCVFRATFPRASAISRCTCFCCRENFRTHLQPVSGDSRREPPLYPMAEVWSYQSSIRHFRCVRICAVLSQYGMSCFGCFDCILYRLRVGFCHISRIVGIGIVVHIIFPFFNVFFKATPSRLLS